MTTYQGKELELFKDAENWKNYFASFIKPYILGDVLEVGAGIGSTTKILCNGNHSSWICLEPDNDQLAKIKDLIESGVLPTYCEPVQGSLEQYSPKNRFDTILYIDVLEHINDDRNELMRAEKLLKEGGYLIILVPAFQCLFSNFDQAIGHYRRYTRQSLKKVIPSSITEKQSFYLDIVGMMSSLSNKWFLKRSYPTKKQVYFWDRVMIAASKRFDPLTKHLAGRALISICQKVEMT
jgi:SAM-dependent methyltransferase